MDEEEMYVETCDSVPKEIEKFYSCTSDSDIEKLRLWSENNSIGNYGLKPGAIAPYFNLLDQDEENVCLPSLLQTGLTSELALASIKYVPSSLPDISGKIRPYFGRLVCAMQLQCAFVSGGLTINLLSPSLSSL